MSWSLSVRTMSKSYIDLQEPYIQNGLFYARTYMELSLVNNSAHDVACIVTAVKLTLLDTIGCLLSADLLAVAVHITSLMRNKHARVNSRYMAHRLRQRGYDISECG